MPLKTTKRLKKQKRKHPLLPDQNVRLGNKVGNQTGPPFIPHGDQRSHRQPHPQTAGPDTSVQDILDVVGEDDVGPGEQRLETEARAPDLGRQDPALLDDAEQIVSSIFPNVVPQGTDHGTNDVAEALERTRLPVPPVLAPLLVSEPARDDGDALVAERLPLGNFVD